MLMKFDKIIYANIIANTIYYVNIYVFMHVSLKLVDITDTLLLNRYSGSLTHFRLDGPYPRVRGGIKKNACYPD